MTSSMAITLLTRIGGLVSSSYFQRKQPIAPPSVGARLAALVDEHSDLDIAISVLLETGNRDALLITRLKKRKLQIKDEIASITPMQQDMISRVA